MSWAPLLAPECEKPAFRALASFLHAELESGARILPALPRVFQAFEDVAPANIRAVILGQDPYPGEGHAIGRSFAVPNPVRPKPPSLSNILKEIRTDLDAPETGLSGDSDLSGWAEQGVLLLNTVLTVRAGQPLSHRGRGWEALTLRVLETIANLPQPVVFLLWGNEARQIGRQMLKARNEQARGAVHLLEAAHPSPLSAHRGFLGCRHFSKANRWLESQGVQPIDWTRISSKSNSCPTLFA